ncbi:MAG: protein BatD [Rikenellaceae bacterium]|nr:protein BatD [Rikenellaceae bacterium]
MIKRLSLCIVALLAAVASWASSPVTFEASAPLLVAAGENFRIEFTVNAEPERNSFEAPTFEGFQLVAGPVTSRGSNMYIVNGSMEKTEYHTYTYVLQGTAKGKYTIGSAAIAVAGKSYRTQPVTIEVVDEGGSQQQGSAAASGARSADNAIGANDLLMRMTVNKTDVFKGEPVVASLKLYKRVSLLGSEGAKFPSFNGFWTQELDSENNMWQRETYDGRIYETLVVREYLLYPQQTGKLRIDPAEMTVVAQIVVPGSSRGFDPFFDQPDVMEVRRKLTTAPVEINVKELPAGAPSSFSGAVGRFTMEATPPTTNFTANSAATYTVKISGTGNLPFVQAPTLSLPSSFELYDVKTTESLKNSLQGISGYRQFEYPFIARAEGEYDIPAVEFTYFDPAQLQYVTLSSRELALTIDPDASGGLSGAPVIGGVSKEEVKLLGQDIRFIKLGSAGLRPVRSVFVGSAGYWICLALLVALFAGVSIYLRKRIKEMQNVTLIRGKRANRVALQRFRAAAKYMDQNDQHGFYEEMLRALWGYMSDKLNIPVANLTKENVREELRKRHIAPETIQQFIDIIISCDEAQYSPMASAQMNEVYAEGVNIISELESTLKK